MKFMASPYLLDYSLSWQTGIFVCPNPSGHATGKTCNDIQSLCLYLSNNILYSLYCPLKII